MKKQHLLVLNVDGGLCDSGYVQMNLQPLLRTFLYASRPRPEAFLARGEFATAHIIGLVSRQRELSDLRSTPVESHGAPASFCMARQFDTARIIYGVDLTKGHSTLQTKQRGPASVDTFQLVQSASSGLAVFRGFTIQLRGLRYPRPNANQQRRCRVPTSIES